jgi:hypothetical protein
MNDYFYQSSESTAACFLETANKSEVSNCCERLEHLKNLLKELQADSGVQQCIKCTKHIQDSAAYFFQQVQKFTEIFN